MITVAPWQIVPLYNPFTHFAMIGGIGSGKSHIGARYVIKQLREHPGCRGFIGANSYDQLSQATLKHLFEAFDEEDIEYVSDCIPPKHWGESKKFKKYANIISVRQTLPDGRYKVTYIFTRVLSAADNLRGIEFSWYWLDETRDTPLYAWTVILGRMREKDEDGSSYQSGLITTSANGRDWIYNKFVLAPKGQRHFGSMHVKTIEAVEAGLIPRTYFDVLLASYDFMLAKQELDAEHLNVTGGRAYYAVSDINRRPVSPWGATEPSHDRPIIVGCDFNYQPAPCIWTISQLGYDSEGRKCLHTFAEYAKAQASTPEMVIAVAQMFPNFTMCFYGDASGTRGATSNHGETDTIQIVETCRMENIPFTIDFDQNNPRVKNRVENMNRLARNARNEVTWTYDPVKCPILDGDVEIVGWKKVTSGRNVQGRLDDMGDFMRTHASDSVGYKLWKLFPPQIVLMAGGTVESQLASMGHSNRE